VRAILVVLGHPGIKVALQLLDHRVDPLAEGDAIEFIEHGLMKALANSVGLRAPRFGAGVVDVLDRQVALILVDTSKNPVLASDPVW
jgi:hypothetical protein